jgi:hypothetical protein
MTALHIACQLNHVDSVSKLVHNGADTKARDNANKTPLDYVFHDLADPHANPFYSYLHALLMDNLSVMKNRSESVKEKIETRYTSMEARINAGVNSTENNHSNVGVHNSSMTGMAMHSTGASGGSKSNRTHAYVLNTNTNSNNNGSSAPTSAPPTNHSTRSNKMRHFSITVSEADLNRLPHDEGYTSLERRGLARVVVGGTPFVLRRSKLLHRKGCKLTEALEHLDMVMSSITTVNISCTDVAGSCYTISVSEGSCIFDRTPDLFPRVVQYLDGNLVLPNSREQLTALRDDAKYYQLPALKDMCELQLSRLHMRRVGGADGHVSIADAVAAAEEGEQIVVCGGVYAESITITKSVTLLADKAADKRVVITGDASGEPSVRIKAGSVLLVGIHIKWQAGRQDSARGCCVEIAGGGLALLESCTLTGPAAYGVFVHPTGRANLQKVTVQVCMRAFLCDCDVVVCMCLFGYHLYVMSRCRLYVFVSFSFVCVCLVIICMCLSRYYTGYCVCACGVPALYI